jgi:hypothetical protein
MKMGTFETDALQDRAGSSVNGTGTYEKSGTPLTQRRSRRVRKYPATPEQRALIALRAKHGADTLAGHICSDIVEQFDSHQFAKATGGAFQLSMLAVLMPAKVGELAKLI